MAYGNATPGDHDFSDAHSLLYGTCTGTTGAYQETVGDVTGDGHLDLATDAHNAWIDGVKRGATFVVSNLPSVRGYASIAHASAAIIVGPGGEGSAFGPPYPAGDLNQDGVDDLIVTSWNAPDNGKVYLFLGPLSGTIHAADADLVIHGGQRDVRFGYHAQGVGGHDGRRRPGPRGQRAGLTVGRQGGGRGVPVLRR